MARPELGIKRVCPTTGRKFYDLNRDPIVSPYTGEELARAAFEPAPAPARATRARTEETDESEVLPVGPETVSLEDVGAAEEEGAAVADDDVAIGEEASESDDTFLEEEEEGGDVSDLIGGDVESDEEG